MTPLQTVLPFGKSRHIMLSPSGELIIPADSIRQLGWKLGTKIRVNYLDTPLVLFVSRASDDIGYTLHNIGQDSDESSSKIRISKLTNDIIRLRVKLPLRGLEPIHLAASTFHNLELAILLEPWTWTATSFDVAGSETIPSKMVGLYEILSADGRILKIGEGQLLSRMREAMKISDLARLGRAFRYMNLEKPDAELLEQVALAEHRLRFSELPQFNPINQ